MAVCAMVRNALIDVALKKSYIARPFMHKK
jgi:hypothetical protein